MNLALIDYGCHAFSYKLSAYLSSAGYPISYLANGSLESPNSDSLDDWKSQTPKLVKIVYCSQPYGKVSLMRRLRGEVEWSSQCLAALVELRPSSIVCSCAPLSVIPRLQSYAASRKIPFIYWLQDLQGRAIGELFKRRVPVIGQSLGRLAEQFEQQSLERSRFVITIAPGHERSLPEGVRLRQRYQLLENWANIEDIPLEHPGNEWAQERGLAGTRNVLYAGTLGLKHDWPTFIRLARALEDQSDVRVVLVSSGGAADRIKAEAKQEKVSNLVVLPFQPFSSVSKVLGAATVLFAPLDPSAGSFCVPSKILSYHCAGRPIVLSIDPANPAAAMLRNANSGIVVGPGDRSALISAVRRLLDDQPSRQQLGLNARSYAELKFNLAQISERFLSILSQAGVSVTSETNTSVPRSLQTGVAAGGL